MRQLRAGDPDAAAVIWEWRREAPSRSTSARPARPARLRGALQALVGGAFGLAAIFFGWHRVGSVAIGLAGGILLSALVSPTGLYAAIQRLFDATGRAIGRATTWAVLVPLFYLFFLPFGMLLRRGRRDQLKRFFERDVDSYWKPRTEVTASSRERQY